MQLRQYREEMMMLIVYIRTFQNNRGFFLRRQKLLMLGMEQGFSADSAAYKNGSVLHVVYAHLCDSSC